MIKYDKFWKTLEDKNISQYVLVTKYKISTSLLTRMRRNESISLATVEKLCNILRCSSKDIVEVLPDKKSK
ncbi:MAG: helix-turn-helix transcriptional regulator [Clostridiales bacterium]|nr:helix-turn-helix transcriptional regulator [Clostridiales bacterium]